MTEKTIPTTQNSENQTMQCEIIQDPKTYVSPLTDIYEEENGIHMLVDLPGVEKDDIKLNIEKNILTIEGHVNSIDEQTYLLHEFEPASYYRQFKLSESFNQENIDAELKNGVLSVFLPREEALTPRTIEVKIN